MQTPKYGICVENIYQAKMFMKNKTYLPFLNGQLRTVTYLGGRNLLSVTRQPVSGARHEPKHFWMAKKGHLTTFRLGQSVYHTLY